MLSGKAPSPHWSVVAAFGAVSLARLLMLLRAVAVRPSVVPRCWGLVSLWSDYGLWTMVCVGFAL